MPALSCGLDFGTSNSTIGYVRANAQPSLVALDEGRVAMPSVLFFSFEADEVHFGRAAIAEYVSGAEGRMLRALKSLLGSSLMDDETRIKARRIPFTEILGTYVGELRRRAEKDAGQPLSRTVAGRPVRFVDEDDAADREAQRQLETAIRGQGFEHIEFQFEPIAAALDYEQAINDEQLAIVADIGGGTSDFTVVRLSPERARSIDRSEDILATGGVHVGGTDFDRLLSLAEIMPVLGFRSKTTSGDRDLPVGPFHDLATWHRINRLYTREAHNLLTATRREAAEKQKFDTFLKIVEGRYGHLLAAHVEDAKIALTDAQTTHFGFEPLGVSLQRDITRKAFEAAIAETAAKIPFQMNETLKRAGLTADRIETVIMTGGSTQIGLIRAALDAMFARARFVETDAFGSVGLGLTLDAARRFGA